MMTTMMAVMIMTTMMVTTIGDGDGDDDDHGTLVQERPKPRPSVAKGPRRAMMPMSKRLVASFHPLVMKILVPRQCPCQLRLYPAKLSRTTLSGPRPQQQRMQRSKECDFMHATPDLGALPELFFTDDVMRSVPATPTRHEASH